MARDVGWQTPCIVMLIYIIPLYIDLFLARLEIRVKIDGTNQSYIGLICPESINDIIYIIQVRWAHQTTIKISKGA